MTRDKFSQNLPDDPDTLKVLFYSYADQLGDPLNKREQAHCVLKAISEKIVRQTGLVKFRGSSEILSDEHLRQIGLVISQAAAAEHAAGQIVAVSESVHSIHQSIKHGHAQELNCRKPSSPMFPSPS